MKSKRKSIPKTRSPKQGTTRGKSEKDRSAFLTRASLGPEYQATLTLNDYNQTFGNLNTKVLLESLTEQIKAVNDGDMKRGEAMLTTQAHTLDAIFNHLAQRAALNMGEHLPACELYLKLALRAQSQCRATWEAVSAIKNPPIMGYVKQANIAHGPQQVNNSTPDAGNPLRARENENLQNELLEENNGERLDTRASGATSGNDPELATVGEVKRAKDSKR